MTRISASVLLFTWVGVAGLEGIAAFQSRHGPVSIPTRQSGLYSTAGDDNGSLRRALEESWNTSKMGRVPIDPEAAAKEAYSSILQAAGGIKAADGETMDETDGMTGTFFVDLLLPSYDITQVVEGTSLYDEVTAVEYCIALADCFKGKTEILVRDNKTVQTVTKVLKAREEREKQEKEAVSDGEVVFGDGNFIDNSSEGSNDEDKIVDSDPQDDFRQQLLASWNDEASAPAEDGIDLTPKKTESAEIPDDPSKSYRLASLFGNRKIIQGADMASYVIQAVRENALAKDDEDNIIILSAIGADEMLAVRGLVAKYQGQKKIIMVNCQFSPVPRELMAAETVYSVLPLAGKKKTNDGTEVSDDENPPPKIVVLRRYPKDWQVFVDVGIGYELAETVPVNGANKRGLGMDVIARAVTRHLDFVSRR